MSSCLACGIKPSVILINLDAFDPCLLSAACQRAKKLSAMTSKRYGVDAEATLSGQIQPRRLGQLGFVQGLQKRMAGQKITSTAVEERKKSRKRDCVRHTLSFCLGLSGEAWDIHSIPRPAYEIRGWRSHTNEPSTLSTAGQETSKRSTSSCSFKSFRLRLNQVRQTRLTRLPREVQGAACGS